MKESIDDVINQYKNLPKGKHKANNPILDSLIKNFIDNHFNFDNAFSFYNYYEPIHEYLLKFGIDEESSLRKFKDRLDNVDAFKRLVYWHLPSYLKGFVDKYTYQSISGKKGIKVYRKLKIHNANNISDYAGAGLYWSFNKQGAEAYNAISEGYKYEVLLTGIAPLSNIDFMGTFETYVTEWEEYEIRMEYDSSVYITEIQVNDEHKVLEKPIKVNTKKESDWYI